MCVYVCVCMYMCVCVCNTFTPQIKGQAVVHNWCTTANFSTHTTDVYTTSVVCQTFRQESLLTKENKPSTTLIVMYVKAKFGFTMYLYISIFVILCSVLMKSCCIWNSVYSKPNGHAFIPFHRNLARNYDCTFVTDEVAP